MSKNLAEITAAEESAAVTFDRESKENEIEKAKKDKDVEYKIKEAEGLDRTLTELSSDKEGVQSERDAIHSYLGELEKQCVVVPETYAERKGHHEAEIAGLKEALSILSEGEVLVQQKSRRTFLRQHSVAWKSVHMFYSHLWPWIPWQEWKNERKRKEKNGEKRKKR